MITIENILDVEEHLDEIDAVIFDLDDTLYSEKQYVRSGYKAVAKYLGNSEYADKLWLYFEDGKAAIDALLSEISLEDKKQECLKVYREHIPDITLYDGAADLITRLKKSKKIGIITDGRPEGQKAKIKALKLEQMVDEIIITDELGGIEFRKPNSKAFRLMQKKFGIPFSQMSYIGDNITKDFLAPGELGMLSIWFKNKDGLYYK